MTHASFDAPPSRRGTPKTRQKDTPSAPSRRQELIGVAAELFAAKGFRATTVRDIADAAGVLSGSLYHHFESKEAILEELLSSYLEDLLEQYEEIVGTRTSPLEALSRLVRAAFASLEEHRAAIAVLQNEGQHLARHPRFRHLRGREAEVQALWVAVIREGIQVGRFRAGMEPQLIYRFVRDAIWVAVKWFRPGGRLSAGDLADQYLMLILEGILTTERTPPAGESGA
ncbi:TetR/AcrR family transcriptional regulator [Streptomyces spiralis]|uniref:TetR/AcrR family transcriptional regulator n=1 Tax=Streptomyces spiralis TaxID=66376 RepID=UPI0033C362F5